MAGLPEGREGWLRSVVSSELRSMAAQAERSGQPQPDIQSQRLAARAICVRELERRRAQILARGEQPLNEDEEETLIQRVMEGLFSGTIGLEALLHRPDVTDILFNGWSDVRVWRDDGVEERVEPVVRSDEELIALVRNLAHRHGHVEREFTPSAPILDLQLDSGSRLAAVAWIADRPYVAIRRYLHLDMSLEDLRVRDMFDAGLLSLFRALVVTRKNIIICGPAAVGKTTLLRALLFECEPNERIVTIEDEPELQLLRSKRLDQVVSLCTRGANVEGVGAISMLELGRAVKRHPARRVVVGEVRGEEILHMFEAMTHGHHGSMCTLHSETGVGVFKRLPLYAPSYPVDRLASLAALAVDFVVVLGLDHDGRRVVSEILLVGDYDPELAQPRLHQLFVRDHSYRATLNVLSPMPVDLLDELIDNGYDPSLHPVEKTVA